MTTALGLWTACSSNKPSGSPPSELGSAGTAGLPGPLGQAGSACTPPASCGAAGNSGPMLALDGGAPSSYGGATATGGANALCQPPALIAPGCVLARPDGTEAECNGLDDDCDGSVDEGCPCTAGDVQPCFLGPPARRHIGACVDGTQTCQRGVEFAAYWGDCTGGIRPSEEKCDGLDNDCNGCADDLDGCKAQFTCPGPNDPRTPAGTPLSPYTIHGHDFFAGAVRTWSWSIQGGPCDTVMPNTPSFTLMGETSETLTFTPKLSGDYTVTMTVTPEVGAPFTCSWIVHIVGPGLRIEMCYPESSTQDLDLYVKQPGHKTPWFTGQAQTSSALDQCSWANCEANLRGNLLDPPLPAGTPFPRANWGYPNSPLSLCANTLQGAVWQGLGYCASPRLDIDNNLSEATGVPENINVDAPKDNEVFRIMVANFSGTDAHPLVNVYCDGRRVATIGAAPDRLTNFVGSNGGAAIGALWRVADVTSHVSGTQTTCTVNVVHPPGASSGFDVTVNDPRY
ncbi:MAG TPA: PKD domain-containing protein [Polyangiaceae bacterium]|nr:PKD domain-containing protein [Polyangiaceae bacterium]